MAYKLDLKKILKALDLRDKNFYDNLTKEEQKAFSPYLIMRYAASTQSTNPLEHQLYSQGVNELVNINFNELSKHPKLIWLLLSMCGSGYLQYHPWLAYKNKKTDNKILKFLENRFPTMKIKDIELMAELNNKKDLQEWAKELGWSKKEIKDGLG